MSVEDLSVTDIPTSEDHQGWKINLRPFHWSLRIPAMSHLVLMECLSQVLILTPHLLPNAIPSHIVVNFLGWRFHRHGPS